MKKLKAIWHILISEYFILVTDRELVFDADSNTAYNASNDLQKLAWELNDKGM